MSIAYPVSAKSAFSVPLLGSLSTRSTVFSVVRYVLLVSVALHLPYCGWIDIDCIGDGAANILGNSICTATFQGVCVSSDQGVVRLHRYYQYEGRL